MSVTAFARRTRLTSGWAVAFRQTAFGLIVACLSSALVVYAVRSANIKGIALFVVAIGSLWLLTTGRPQLGLAVVLLYLGLLDGYLKLATGSSIVTFVRDALLFSLAIGVLVRALVTRQRLSVPPLGWFLVGFTAIAVVEFANPDAGTIAHSLAGARQNLEFVPLFFLTYTFVRTTKSLRILCVLLAVVAAANGVVGWVQFKETPTQFAAWGPGYSERILGTGAFAGAGRTAATTSDSSVTRPFGLGSDAGDGGLFGMIALCGILALAAYSRRRQYQLFAAAMAILAVVSIVTSQGRSVILGSVITILGFAVLTLKSGNRLKSISGLMTVVGVTVVVIAAVIGATGSGGFRYNNLGPSGVLNTTSQARGASIVDIPANIEHYPFGAGLGTAGPASGSPGASTLTQANVLDVETAFSYLVLETGIAGLVVFVGFVLTLLWLGFTRVRNEPDPEAKILLSALIAPLMAIFVQFFISSPTPSVPLGPYIFALGGIVSYWLVALPAARAREAQRVLPGTSPEPAVAAIAAPNVFA